MTSGSDIAGVCRRERPEVHAVDRLVMSSPRVEIRRAFDLPLTPHASRLTLRWSCSLQTDRMPSRGRGQATAQRRLGRASPWASVPEDTLRPGRERRISSVMVELPARTVTLFFADIERSTTLAHRLGDEFGDVLDDFWGLLRAAASEAGGQEVDSRADEFFAAFPSASDGVSAATAAQRQFGLHDWPGGLRVRVRIGLHTGEPAVRHGAYLGVAVHFAARVCAAGHGGQVLVSQATHHLCGADMVTRDLGLYELAGMPQPARLFQVVAPGLRTSFPPLERPRLAGSTGFGCPSGALDGRSRSRRRCGPSRRMLPEVEPESRAALIGLGSSLRVADRASNGAAELLRRVDDRRLDETRCVRQDAIRSQRAQLRWSIPVRTRACLELADRRRHLFELVSDLGSRSIRR